MLRPTSALVLATLLVGACSSGAPEPDALATDVPDEFASGEVTTPINADELVEGATPMAERVATIGLLNKRNNVTEDFEMRPGETRRAGAVIIRLQACERTAPWEMPQETGAFVQVLVQERGDDDFTGVFSGWLFKNSPSLNVVEHPIYDVWVKDCAMAFPGEE
jgi:hypothetical protein